MHRLPIGQEKVGSVERRGRNVVVVVVVGKSAGDIGPGVHWPHGTPEGHVAVEVRLHVILVLHPTPTQRRRRHRRRWDVPVDSLLVLPLLEGV